MTLTDPSYAPDDPFFDFQSTMRACAFASDRRGCLYGASTSGPPPSISLSTFLCASARAPIVVSERGEDGRAGRSAVGLGSLARTGDAEGCGRQDTAADQRNGERIRNDVLIVWKLGGFGRSLKHLVTALDELEALGVAFISLRDSIDLSTPQGKLMLAVIGAMAEFERGSVSRRRESVVLYER